MTKGAKLTVLANAMTKQLFEQGFGNWPIAEAHGISQAGPFFFQEGSQFFFFDLSRIAFVQERDHKGRLDSTQSPPLDKKTKTGPQENRRHREPNCRQERNWNDAQNERPTATFL